MFFRRETIIALRARHQAHRIASEVMNPHVDVQGPRPVMSARLDVGYHDPLPLLHRLKHSGRNFAEAVFWVLVSIALVLAMAAVLVALKHFTG